LSVSEDVAQVLVENIYRTVRKIVEERSDQLFALSHSFLRPLAFGDVASHAVHNAFFGEISSFPLDPGDVPILAPTPVLEALYAYPVGNGDGSIYAEFTIVWMNQIHKASSDELLGFVPEYCLAGQAHTLERPIYPDGRDHIQGGIQRTL
jgi:hypothetical protein